jgi:hypothetical protein
MPYYQTVKQLMQLMVIQPLLISIGFAASNTRTLVHFNLL